VFAISCGGLHNHESVIYTQSVMTRCDGWWTKRDELRNVQINKWVMPIIGERNKWQLRILLLYGKPHIHHSQHNITGRTEEACNEAKSKNFIKNSFMFAMVPFHLLFFIWVYIACFFVNLFISTVYVCVYSLKLLYIGLIVSSFPNVFLVTSCVE